MPARKIATCCYCGTRAALVLRGNDRHELSCSSCGAPLHDMKMLPIAPEQAAAPTARPARHRPEKPARETRYTQPKRPKKSRKTKSLGRKVAAELWDFIEDIFD